jgi:hypothetical protein
MAVDFPSGWERGEAMTNETSILRVESLLPEQITKMLHSCPKAGNGVHSWLYNTALRLHPFFGDKNCIADLLRRHSADCGRDVGEQEIWNAIENSESWLAGQKGKSTEARTVARWPARNEEQIEAITKAGPDLAGLIAMPPMRWIDEQPHTEEIIDILFPGNPLLCAGLKKESALTRTREEWRGFMANRQFIVPSPMIAIRGKTKNGRESMRCLANTGTRLFLVVEFDQGSFDQHAALLVHLAKSEPLALVVHSGNKSLHGWFLAKKEEAQSREFMCSAVSLGADHATWTRCQYVRMPDGRRDNGKRQRVVYFNPATLEFK